MHALVGMSKTGLTERHILLDKTMLQEIKPIKIVHAYYSYFVFTLFKWQSKYKTVDNIIYNIKLAIT